MSPGREIERGSGYGLWDISQRLSFSLPNNFWGALEYLPFHSGGFGGMYVCCRQLPPCEFAVSLTLSMRNSSLQGYLRRIRWIPNLKLEVHDDP